MALRRVNRRLAQLREQICDDFASSNALERRQLAEVLVKIAGWNPAASLRVRAATALVDDARDDLAGRVTRLVENQPRSMHLTPRGAVAVAGFACLLAALVLLATLRAAPVERFERTPEQQTLIAELQKNGISVIDDWSTNTFQVRVDDRRATDADVARLLDLGRVGDLHLSGEKLTDAALESAGHLSDLTKLSLGFGSDFPFSAEGARTPEKPRKSGRIDDLVDLPERRRARGAQEHSASVQAHPLVVERLRPRGSRSWLIFRSWKSLASRIAGAVFRMKESRQSRESRLAQLSINSNDMTDAGLQALSKSASLTTLSLHGSRFTDEGLHAIAAMPNLTSLSIQGKGITARAFAN